MDNQRDGLATEKTLGNRIIPTIPFPAAGRPRHTLLNRQIP